MKNVIKAIVKRPREKVGHTDDIGNSLYYLQRLVDGPIETITMANGNVIICNEEARIRNMDYNFTYCYPYTVANGDVITMQMPIFGPVVICGVDGEDFTDLSISLKKWSDLLHNWGN